jgi:hypothetical protein
VNLTDKEFALLHTIIIHYHWDRDQQARAKELGLVNTSHNLYDKIEKEYQIRRGKK